MTINTQHVENLVFEGGGTKGFALLGAVRYLQEHNILPQIKRVIGSSIGSLLATLVSCKVSYDEAEKAIKSFDFASLKDCSYYGYVGDGYRLYNSYSICEGEKLSQWYKDLLKQFTGNAEITFGELWHLTNIELVITATNLNFMKIRYFSYKTDHDVPVWLAMRMSSSIPFFFKSVKFQGDHFVDGGVLNNYPIWYFEPQNEITSLHDMYKIKTIGFKMISADERFDVHDSDKIEMSRKDINNIKDFITTLADAMCVQIERGYIHKDYFKQTVPIPTGNISSTDFDITLEQKEYLINQGYLACKNNLN